MEQFVLNKIIKDLNIICLSLPVKSGHVTIKDLGEFPISLKEGTYPFFDETRKTDGYVVLSIERLEDNTLSHEWIGDDVDLTSLIK